jgi:hypothetical protein
LRQWHTTCAVCQGMHSARVYIVYYIICLGCRHCLGCGWHIWPGAVHDRRGLSSSTWPLSPGGGSAGGGDVGLWDVLGLVLSPSNLGASALESTHAATHLPWWASVPITAAAARGALLPLSLRARAASERFQLMHAAIEQVVQGCSGSGMIIASGRRHFLVIGGVIVSSKLLTTWQQGLCCVMTLCLASSVPQCPSGEVSDGPPPRITSCGFWTAGPGTCHLRVPSSQP